MLATATFSPCRTFRYSLSRTWDADLPRVVFVGLNPSTADESTDDPTVRRCIGFARSWGFGRLVLVNLFAYRATDPDELLQVSDPIGPANDASVLTQVQSADRVVVAWGAGGTILGRDQHVLSLLPPPDCLGKTKGGVPRHPLYIRANTRLRPYFSVAPAPNASTRVGKQFLQIPANPPRRKTA